jgi:hypothetical protein
VVVVEVEVVVVVVVEVVVVLVSPPLPPLPPDPVVPPPPPQAETTARVAKLEAKSPEFSHPCITNTSGSSYNANRMRPISSSLSLA